jgi:cation transport ATPase
MLDPVREKCDLHIRAAGIFIMQLDLLEIRRLVALSHNEGPIVDEESIFATALRTVMVEAQASGERAVSGSSWGLPLLSGLGSDLARQIARNISRLYSIRPRGRRSRPR